jgi:hypothetical protein
VSAALWKCIFSLYLVALLKELLSSFLETGGEELTEDRFPKLKPHIWQTYCFSREGNPVIS